MAYAVLQDLIDRYGADELTQLTDQIGAGVPDATVAGVAIDDASNLIDGFVAGRYQLPLAPVPAQVKRWACDIARFYLWRDKASDHVTALYTGAMASLKMVAGGQLTLEAAAIETAESSDAAELAGPGRIFSRDTMGRF